MSAKLEVEDHGPVDKDVLYEKLRQPKKHRVQVSKISRMLQSEQFKNTRKELDRVREATFQLRAFAEESVRKAKETVNYVFSLTVQTNV